MFHVKHFHDMTNLDNFTSNNRYLYVSGARHAAESARGEHLFWLHPGIELCRGGIS